MTEKFSFAEHAAHFDRHIDDSIQGMSQLREMCVGLSRHYVRHGARVVDIGCSTGSMLRSIRDANADRDARYVGVDVEPMYSDHWRHQAVQGIEFFAADARRFEGLGNASLAISLFTLQFLPEPDRPDLLRRVYEALEEGGALIIAEKVMANSPEFQAALTFGYFDFKRRSFTPEEILNKEKALRGQMIPWSEQRLMEALYEAGFEPGEVQRFWQNFLFVGMLAVKRGRPRWRSRIYPTARPSVQRRRAG